MVPEVQATPKADEPTSAANGPGGAFPVGNDGGTGTTTGLWSWGALPRRPFAKRPQQLRLVETAA